MKIPFDTEAAVNRRSLLKGMGATAGLAALPGVLAACGGDDSSGGDSTPAAGGTPEKKAVGTVTMGSNASDAVPKASYEKVFADFKSTLATFRLALTPFRSVWTPFICASSLAMR